MRHANEQKITRNATAPMRASCCKYRRRATTVGERPRQQDGTDASEHLPRDRRAIEDAQ
jgi:hypothetical protein